MSEFFPDSENQETVLTGGAAVEPDVFDINALGAEPPKKSNKKTWIIVLVVVLLLCCCCLAAIVILGTQVDWNMDYNLDDLMQEFTLLNPAALSMF